MEVKAKLNGIRLAPRKVRAVVNIIKKKDALVALNQLEHLVRRPSIPLSKLIRSAISNAEKSYNMVAENLYIKDFIVDEGVKLKRYLPRAQGRATELQKKTSLITVVLDERVAGLKKEKTEKQLAKEESKKEHIQVEGSKKSDKPEIDRELGKKTVGSKVKRFFSRKAV